MFKFSLGVNALRPELARMIEIKAVSKGKIKWFSTMLFEFALNLLIHPRGTHTKILGKIIKDLITLELFEFLSLQVSGWIDV